MSDSSSEQSAGSSEAPGNDAGTGEPGGKRELGYRIIELRFDADGGFRGITRFFLTECVYSRSVAMRFVAHEARKADAADGYYVLQNPAGRVISVVDIGSGRAAGTATVLRVRRAIRELFPQTTRKRRTSRPAGPRATRPESSSSKRRTSRRVV